LNIFSLFRQEVTEGDYAGVFRKKTEGAKFNDVLVKMSDLDFKDLVNVLVDWRLISCDEAKKTYTTHPLIKAYFESDFSDRNKKLCHKRIYGYVGEYAPGWPDTLEEMQPLFEQVYHGCAAGLYDEVWDDVYRKKIYGYNDRILTIKLGAWETGLSLVRNFFPEGDVSQMPLVSKKGKQGWLFNEAGLALLITGRPKEAEEALLTAIKLYTEAKDRNNVSGGYRNLADLQFRTGGIESSVESAKKACDMSEKAKDDFNILKSHAYLGRILYLLGKTDEAENEFKEADELEMKIDPKGCRLYGQRGVNYATFLISMERIDEAFEVTKQNLELCESEGWTNDISRCHRCLGAIERTKGNYKEAERHLQKALEIARRIGIPELEIEAMLESGRLALDTGKYEDAIGDAESVLKICRRTGFRFYEPEGRIVFVKAYLALKDFEKAEGFAKSAYEKAAGMKYRWAEGEAADLLGEIYSVRGDKAKGRKWLKKAVG
jgi:tetratricopeptide (TPR) repeat protein